MGKTVSLICDECGASFQKLKGEYNRRTREGATEFFCSISCGVVSSHRKNPRPGTPENLYIGGWNKGIYSPFKWFLRRVKSRSWNSKRRAIMNSEMDLSEDFLKELWFDQNGICPFTGWKLKLPSGGSGWVGENTLAPDSASLDRIDNSKSYIKGNVRFVAVMANYARNIFSDEELIKFGNSIANYHRVQISNDTK